MHLWKNADRKALIPHETASQASITTSTSGILNRSEAPAGKAGRRKAAAIAKVPERARRKRANRVHPSGIAKMYANRAGFRLLACATRETNPIEN